MALTAAAPSLFDQLPATAGARSTLDELIVATWRGVRTRGEADCPVCGGRMVRGRRSGGQRDAVAAGCSQCGAELD